MGNKVIILKLVVITSAAADNFEYHPNTVLNVSNATFGWMNASTESKPFGETLQELNELSTGPIGYYEKMCNLHRHLFQPKRYNPLFPPNNHPDAKITVQIKLKLFDLVNIDDVDQTMVTNCKFIFIWFDQFLRWSDLVDYKDIVYIGAGISDIWKPGIELFNSPKKKNLLGFDSEIPPTLVNNGVVMWMFDSYLTTSCNLYMDKFPFDVQTCHIELKSATTIKKNMELVVQEGDFDTSMMMKNYGWELVDTKSWVDDIEIDGYLFPRVVLSLRFKRKPSFILLHALMPTVLLSFLNCFIFLLPLDSGERIGFGMSVLIALSVCFSYTSEMLPRATDGTPTVTKYLCSLLVSSIIAVIITACNVQLRQYITKNSKEDNHPHHNQNNNQVGDDSCRLEDGRYDQPRRVQMLATLLRYTEKLGFLLTTGLWIAVTLVYFIHVSF